MLEVELKLAGRGAVRADAVAGASGRRRHRGARAARPARDLLRHARPAPGAQRHHAAPPDGRGGAPGLDAEAARRAGRPASRDELDFDGSGADGPGRAARAGDGVRAPERARAGRAAAHAAPPLVAARTATARSSPSWSTTASRCCSAGRVVERFREVEIEGRALDRAGAGADRARAGGGRRASAAPAGAEGRCGRSVSARRRRPTWWCRTRCRRRTRPARRCGRRSRAASSGSCCNDPRTRLGEVEPLHQMRVGTRRLRSDLRTFAAAARRASGRTALREELRWLGDALGEVRDLDVMLRAAARARPGTSSPTSSRCSRRSRARRAARARALLTALRSARYVELLDRLVEAARKPALTPLRPRRRAARRCRRSCGGPGRSSREAGAGAATPTARTRTITVCVCGRSEPATRPRRSAPALARDAAAARARFAERAAEVQDILGELQDTVVAARGDRDGVASASRAEGPSTSPPGRMLERERARAQRARAGVPRRVERGWTGKKRRRWMKR